MSMAYLKIIVYVPLANADAVRKAIGYAGGGKIGNYSFCSFSSRGVGRFLPETGAHPATGEIGKLEQVEEERIEFVCEPELRAKVVEAIKRAHPYEEPAIDIWPVEIEP
ncbi:MAG: hypothetical protein Q7S01_01070 [bacterium]|nr:hypothetical protein [bacterium]